MAIRVTQQYLQYLADPTTESDVRVTKVHAQVAIVISSTVVVEAATNTIFATDPTVVQGGGTTFLGVTNVFFDGATDNEATYDPVFNIFVSQQLFNGAAGQSADALYFAVAQTLFSDNASPDAVIDVTQYLGWTDRHFEQVGNALGWTGNGTIAVVDSVANFFFTNPSFDNRVEQAHIAANDLGFADSAVLNSTQFVENVFAMSNTVDFSGPQSRIESQGFLKQTVDFVIDDNACREQEFAPLIGSSDDDSFDDFDLTVPTFDAGTLVLTHPATSPTLTLTLDNPGFGDENLLSFTRIDRTTRGNVRHIYSDPKWASWERLTFTVDGICQETRDTIIAFLNASLGEKIGLADWEGRTWEGFIVAPDTDIEEDTQGFKLDLTFEGIQVSLDVRYGLDGVIYGQDVDGLDIKVTYDD